jgi:IclR family pca regulon transcriptional regulator
LKHIISKEKDFVTSLARGLTILEAFDLTNPIMGITDLARKTGLSKSTVFRLVQTLRSREYIIDARKGKKYTLGPKVLGLGFAVLSGLELREVAQPYLMDLSRQIRQTVNLAVLDEWKLIYIERIKTHQIVSIDLHVGSRLELYNTAMGRVLAAFQGKDWISQYLKYLKQFQEAKPYWIENGRKLKKILEDVRKNNFSINNEDLAPGLRSVAAPVINREEHVVGAVNIAVSSSLYSLQRLKQELISPLLKTTHAISKSLGFKTYRISKK